MILSESDAVYAADKFINYFSNMDRIDEYLRNVKIERVLNRSPCLLYTSPSPRDRTRSRMPSSA